VRSRDTSTKNTTLIDIADALHISTSTVHRALNDGTSVRAVTRARVQQMAKKMGYRPNLAARFLKSNRHFTISVNTLKGTTSFWDEVREGIRAESESLAIRNVSVEFRTYPGLGKGEQEAFEQALGAGVDGIIMFPTRPDKLARSVRRAVKSNVPVICVATDAPKTERLAVVSIDTLVSGSLAADLMGKLLRGAGKVAVTLSDLAITEHAEKRSAFENTIRAYYPNIRVEATIEDHDVESEAYDKARKLFQACPALNGVYVTTEASIPVLTAARDAGILERLTIITTDLFPALVPQIRSGAVTATIYQRPRTQGALAFRVLHEFLTEGKCPTSQVTLAPHLVMQGNLDFFLHRQSKEFERAEKAAL
jgi:LacI family transcriptional regulator